MPCLYSEKDRKRGGTVVVVIKKLFSRGNVREIVANGFVHNSSVLS